MRGRPFKKGVSGNIKGRPRTLAKTVGLVPRDEFDDLVLTLFWSRFDELREIAKSPTSSALKAMIAGALVGDFKRMKFNTLDRLLDRVIGEKHVKEYVLVCPRCNATKRLDGSLENK